MSAIAYIDHEEFLVGADHPSATDVLNRPVKDLLTKSGLDPAASFGGFANKQSAVDQFAQDFGATVGLTYAYKGGTVAPNGLFAQVAGGTIVLTPNATNYVEHDAAGAVFKSTVGFTSTRTPMAKITTDAVGITLVTDSRALGIGRATPRLSPRVHGTAVGDGIADDGPAILAVEAVAGSAGLEHHPGVYHFATSCTLAKAHRFHPGARLQPANGVNIRMSGLVEAHDHWIFDTSLGGTFSFDKCHAFRVEWFGIVGDDATDDQPALAKMSPCLPEGAALYFSGGLNIRLRNPWRIAARLGLKFYAPNPNVANTSAVNFKWDGDLWGRMIQLDHCNGVEFIGGFIFWTSTIEMMGTVAATMTLGAPTTLVDNGPARFTPNMAGKRVAVLGAGVGGRVLYARVQTYVDDHTLTLDTACSTAVSLTRAYVGSINGLPASCSIDHMGEPNSGNEIGLGTMALGSDFIDSFSDTASYGYEVYKYNYFFPDSVSRAIAVPGAGPGGATLNTTIAEYISPTRVRLAALASTASSGLQFTITGLGGGGGIGSAAVFKYCQFNGGSVPLPELNHVRISVMSIQNHEFHRYYQCNMFGGGLGYMGFLNWSVSTTIGTPTITSAGLFHLFGGSANDNKNMIGQRIRIELAGPGGGILDAKIIGRTDNNTITIDRNATTTQAGVYAALGEGLGDCIVIGASANAHGHTIERCNFTFMRRGIDIGSSFVGRSNTFASGGDIGYYLRGNSRPVVLDYDVMEGTGSYFFQVIAGPGALFCRGLAFGMEGTIPHSAVFDFGLSGNTMVDGIGYDGTPTTTRPVFRFTRSSGSFVGRGTRHYPGTGGITMAQAGYTTNLQTYIEVIGDLNLLGAPGDHFILGGNFGRGTFSVAVSSDSDGPAAITGKFTNRGGAMASRGAIRGQAESSSGAGVSGVLSAVEGAVGQETDGFSGVMSACFRAIMPTFAGFFCNSTHPIHGLLIESPVLSSGFLQQLYGIRVKAQSGTGVSGVHGIWQEGTSDPNFFAGLTSFGSGRVEMATPYIDIGVGGNATPNAAGAEVYRYRLAGAGTANKPLNLVKGMRFKLIFFNNTGAPVTPALNAAYLGAGFGAIGANKSRSRDFVYDDVLDKLEPIGAVSEDF